MFDNAGTTEAINRQMIGELRRVPKRLHYPLEVMLVCARWYAAYPLSFGKIPSPRHLEEMLQKRGVFVDHSTVHRWALKMLPVMASFAAESARLGRVGAWMKPTSKSPDNGDTCPVR